MVQLTKNAGCCKSDHFVNFYYIPNYKFHNIFITLSLGRLLFRLKLSIWSSAKTELIDWTSVPTAQ
jgi:hypothetical protein